MRSLATQFGIDLVMVHNIVAVHGALACLQVRRAVHMRHAKLADVVRCGCRLVKGKAGMQLQPVRR